MDELTQITTAGGRHAVRRAVAEDVAAIVDLIAADQIGRQRFAHNQARPADATSNPQFSSGPMKPKSSSRAITAQGHNPEAKVLACGLPAGPSATNYAWRPTGENGTQGTTTRRALSLAA